MASSRLISVVVPALNEEDNIRPFYEAVRQVTDTLSDFQWELLFIDDGSTDATVENILSLRESDPRVCVIQLSRNFGSYAAIKAGFDYARGDAVISISGDLQDPPDLFRDFTQLWSDGNHIVWGVREERDDPWTKRLAANLFYRLLRRLALTDLPRHGMDCGLFDRKVIEAFREIHDKNGITFMTIYWMGFRQARVPYRRGKRRFGNSKWPIGKRVKSAIDVITAFSFLPVRIASYLGLLISITAFAGACVVLFDRIVLRIGELGWPSLMIVILFLGGVQLLMLGIIGEYLWRMNSEVRGRPQYIVMEEVGLECNRSELKAATNSFVESTKAKPA